MGNVPSVDGGWTSMRVLLGGGTPFNQPLDAAGDVTFSDPSLTQPQTVTEVLVGGAGDILASTMLYANRPEVCLPASASGAQSIPVTVLNPVGTVTARRGCRAANTHAREATGSRSEDIVNG